MVNFLFQLMCYGIMMPIILTERGPVPCEQGVSWQFLVSRHCQPHEAGRSIIIPYYYTGIIIIVIIIIIITGIIIIIVDLWALMCAFYLLRARSYVAADPPFIGIELDISDSGREGCAVSTLTSGSGLAA